MSINKNFFIDLTYLQEVSNDNNEFMIEMINIFLQQTPGYVESLENAILENDWTKTAEFAHKIKPTLTFIGVDSAREVMASIETRARSQQDLDGLIRDFNEMKDVFTIIYEKLEDKIKELEG